MNPSAASGRRAAAKMNVTVAALNMRRKSPRRTAMVDALCAVSVVIQREGV